MARTIHRRALQRAAELLGGTDQLHIYLRVSRSQLQFWMEGGEALPPDLFLRLVDLILEYNAPGASGTRRIRVGPNTARCPTCDAIDFKPLVADAQITNMSVMVCSQCQQQTTHGSLVASAADDGAKRSAAWVSRMKKERRELEQLAPESEEDSSEKD